MNVIVLCPNLRCKAVLHVPEEARGRQIRCGQCGTQLTVPTKKAPGAPTPTQGTPGAGTKASAIEE